MLIGLIGKANAGKSTFFNAATELAVPAADYPFTTITPNIGVAYTRVKCVCREFGIQDKPVNSICVDGNRFIPVKLVDVPGLVPGAHTGRGLGNKFLDDARQADALIHVVDASGSTNSEGKAIPPGTGDPLFDIKFVEEEFDLWLASIISKDWTKIAREEDEQEYKVERLLTRRLSGLAIGEAHIVDALNKTELRTKKPVLWTEKDIFNFSKAIRTSAKPIVIAGNKADLPSTDENINNIKATGRDVIICASIAESLLRRAAKKGILQYLPGDNSFDIKAGVSLNDQQKKALDFIRSLIAKLGSTGIQEVINLTCFKMLKLIVVYPVEDEVKLTDKKGNILPDARLISEGATAKDLANMIHGDLGKGFLYAIDVRSKLRLGGEYKLKNNDVIKIVSKTSRG